MRRHFALALATLALIAPSCSDDTRNPIILGNDLNDGGGTGFVAPSDAGADAEGGLIQYCPSNRCPEGHVTCPESQFACDVDLQTDTMNCGACGATCFQGSNSSLFECVAGTCVLHCAIGPTYLDCDGIPDNGCEVRPNTNENCGACGHVCSDPANPCVEAHPDTYQCGCPSNERYCPADAEHDESYCVTHDDDNNCGACGHACDPKGDGTKPSFPNEYFGCLADKCNNPKCQDDYADCDGNPLNGCEAYMVSDTDCGGCGRACAAGQKCAEQFGQPFCACPPGETFCGSCPQLCNEAGCFDLPCQGACFDLTSDVNACGSCDVACNSGPATIPVCSYGTCGKRCPDGRADCNGNESDGCEVRTDTDPGNCGGCGIQCDAVAGQACVGGRCVVEPCDQVPSDSGVAR